LNFEWLHHAIQAILDGTDIAAIPPENLNDANEEETPDEEDSSPPVFGHFSDNIFQLNFETVHPYNTRSKTQNKPSPKTSRNVVSKHPKKTETKQKYVAQF
jgi:hypothetical protein